MLIDNHLNGWGAGRDVKSQVPVSLFDVRTVAVDSFESLWRAERQAVGTIANNGTCEALALHRLWVYIYCVRKEETRVELTIFLVCKQLLDVSIALDAVVYKWPIRKSF